MNGILQPMSAGHLDWSVGMAGRGVTKDGNFLVATRLDTSNDTSETGGLKQGFNPLVSAVSCGSQYVSDGRVWQYEVRTAFRKPYGPDWSCISAFRGPRFWRSSPNHTVGYQCLLEIPGLHGLPQTIRLKLLLYKRLLRSEVWRVLPIPYGRLSAPFEVPSLDSPAQTIQAKLLLYHRLFKVQGLNGPPQTIRPKLILYIGWSSNYTTETAPVSSPFEIQGSNGSPPTIRYIISTFWDPRFEQSSSNHSVDYQRLLRSQVLTILQKPYGRNNTCISAFSNPRFWRSCSNHIAQTAPVWSPFEIPSLDSRLQTILLTCFCISFFLRSQVWIAVFKLGLDSRLQTIMADTASVSASFWDPRFGQPSSN